MSTEDAMMNMGYVFKFDGVEGKLQFNLKKQSSCACEFRNQFDGHVAFMVKTTNPENYCVRPNVGVVLPGSIRRVIVTRQAQREAPLSMKCPDGFLVQTIRVKIGATVDDITPQMFNKESIIDEHKVGVRYLAESQVPSSVPEVTEEESSTKESDSQFGNDLQYSAALEHQTWRLQNHSLLRQGDWVLSLLNVVPDGAEAIEVGPSKTSNRVVDPPVDQPLSARVTWIIKNFSRLHTKELYSDVFIVGGCKWRILIFPKGNDWRNNADYFSLYLEATDSQTLPNGWSKYTQFSISVVNQVKQELTLTRSTQYQFNARENSWGFPTFMPFGELYDTEWGFLVNDTLFVQVDVAILDCVSNDFKEANGYVGIKNERATIYLNSLLQNLYHIPFLRKAVYLMPTTENDIPTESIPLSLQKLFYKLQYSNTSVYTKELIKSFGWDTFEIFTQQHVQEFNRILCEKLEAVMKGTFVEETIQQLFKGRLTSYSECISVDFNFSHLMLDVRGCRDVFASFNKYVEAESEKNENKNRPEQHRLEDAKRGVLFIEFPPVLQLLLKRFEYDLMRDTMVKVNDHYEYPLQLDLDRENGKYLAPHADRSVRNLYTLYSVLVHSAYVHGGHYFSYIRPMLSDQWFKFDDERVTKVDMKTVLEEQYGGEKELPQENLWSSNSPSKFTKYSNAYMLVYIRESDKEKIMCSFDEKDIAEHLQIGLMKEQKEEELKRKEKEEDLCIKIKVAHSESFHKIIGKEIFFDLVDNRSFRSFSTQMNIPFFAFKEEVAKYFGIPPHCQRFWLWAKRQNHTYRPYRPLTIQEEAQSISQVKEISCNDNSPKLELFLEVQYGKGSIPIPPPEKTKDDILLFFKHYDPVMENLRYVGHLFVKATGKPIDIIKEINEMAGFSPDQEIELYEEIKFKPSVMCEYVDKKLQFCSSRLEDGDIICIQKYPRSDEQCRYPDVPSFLEYVQNRQVVRFRSLEKPQDDDFSLELSKLHKYDDVVERVARHLGLEDPSKVCLTAHNCFFQQPKPQSIKYRGVDHLSDMLVHCDRTSDILYYEILDIPLPEFHLKTLISFYHATKDKVVSYSIRLYKQSTVGDVLADLKTKVELSHPNVELRLLEVLDHKIYKIFHHNEKIENINDQYWSLRAEEIPEEEKNLGPHDILIQIYHSLEGIVQNQANDIGKPFLFVIRYGEILLAFKLRVQKKLQVPDEEFSKWKFFVPVARSRIYLQDSDVLSNNFEKRSGIFAREKCVGVEHSGSVSGGRRICVAREGSHVEWIFHENDKPNVENDVAQPRVTCEDGSASVVVSSGQNLIHKHTKNSVNSHNGPFKRILKSFKRLNKY